MTNKTIWNALYLTSPWRILFPLYVIVSFSTAEGFARDDNSMVTGWETFLQALGYFLKMFFGSAALGTLTGLISAIVSSLCVWWSVLCSMLIIFPFNMFKHLVNTSLLMFYPWPLCQFLKHFDLRKTPSLEFGMMIIFAYLPYGLAEGIKLSGESSHVSVISSTQWNVMNFSMHLLPYRSPLYLSVQVSCLSCFRGLWCHTTPITTCLLSLRS